MCCFFIWYAGHSRRTSAWGNRFFFIYLFLLSNFSLSFFYVIDSFFWATFWWEQFTSSLITSIISSVPLHNTREHNSSRHVRFSPTKPSSPDDMGRLTSASLTSATNWHQPPCASSSVWGTLQEQVALVTAGSVTLLVQTRSRLLLCSKTTINTVLQ